MKYEIELSRRAVRDLEILYLSKNAAGSDAAARWFTRLERAIDSLAISPGRCPLIPESQIFAHPLRHLLFGKRSHVYRVIFEIDKRRRIVFVVTIRHGARDKLRPAEIVES